MGKETVLKYREVRKEIVGDFLRDWRLKSGWTQAQVAKHLKYSTPQFVSNWERGNAMPPLDVLPKLCDLYGISRNTMLDTIIRYQDCMYALEVENVRAQVLAK